MKVVVLISLEKDANGGFWSDSTAEIVLTGPPESKAQSAVISHND